MTRRQEDKMISTQPVILSSCLLVTTQSPRQDLRLAELALEFEQLGIYLGVPLQILEFRLERITLKLRHRLGLAKPIVNLLFQSVELVECAHITHTACGALNCFLGLCAVLLGNNQIALGLGFRNPGFKLNQGSMKLLDL